LIIGFLFKQFIIFSQICLNFDLKAARIALQIFIPKVGLLSGGYCLQAAPDNYLWLHWAIPNNLFKKVQI